MSSDSETITNGPVRPRTQQEEENKARIVIRLFCTGITVKEWFWETSSRRGKGCFCLPCQTVILWNQSFVYDVLRTKLLTTIPNLFSA